MNDLYMGVVDKNAPFKLHPEKLRAHTFITGQSGCGKSSVVSRFIEELILREVGSVLLFDYNQEFSKFDQIDQGAFGKNWNKENCPEDQLNIFTRAWETFSKDFQIINSGAINIKYFDISSELKAYLYGIDQDKDAGAFWLIQLIDQTSALSSRVTSKARLKSLVSDIERWFERRLSKDDECLGEVIHQLPQRSNKLDLTKFANGVNRLTRQSFINFKSIPSKVLLNKTFFASLQNETKFCEIDLLNFDYDHYTLRGFVALHTLRCIWDVFSERYRLSRESGDIGLKPLFIVIDEAHNIIPEDNEVTSGLSKETVRLLKTIAAEGRKFGLFLILISQRPNKINENVLSECDNFIVMKSTPPTIDIIMNLLPVEDKKKHEVRKSFRFKTGEALYCGKFTDHQLHIVDGDIKRTM